MDHDIVDELLLILEGFAAALDNRDVLMIKAIWIGLRKYLLSLKLCAREIEKTEESNIACVIGGGKTIEDKALLNKIKLKI